MKKFKYQFVNLNNKTSQEIFIMLNKLGTDGWELMNTPNISEFGINTNMPMFVFKKEFFETKL